MKWSRIRGHLQKVKCMYAVNNNGVIVEQDNETETVETPIVTVCIVVYA